MRRIIRFALFGAGGFGIGGGIGGIIAVDAATFFGFAIMGGIGGMSLGLALKSWRMAGFLALAGMVGLSLGIFISVFIGMAFPLPSLLGRLTVAGAVTGLALGLPLKSWKASGILALTGALAFIIVEQVQIFVPLGLITPQLLSRVIQMVIWGVIGGTLWGVALGYLTKTLKGAVLVNTIH
ncbi:MAG: hypothetical protein Q7K41_03810 [Dehalococcoidales bacterium]|nr:hypothetical protein [Dehalococcoidales bacterium]